MSREVVPECRGRGCLYTYYVDPLDNAVMVMQHGDNPESVMRISRLYRGTTDEARRNAEQQYREFAERCHEYEDRVAV